MTKDQAIDAMRAGQKVTHEYFCSDEWVTIVDERLVFEDGVKPPWHEFWADRNNRSWETGWSIFKEV